MLEKSHNQILKESVAGESRGELGRAELGRIGESRAGESRGEPLKMGSSSREKADAIFLLGNEEDIRQT